MSEELLPVLVVDDEIRSLETITRTLDDDYRILPAASAAEALELLARERVAVILSDQRMPEKTGVEFLAEVRERWPDIPRIIISGYTDADNIIRAINDAGIYHYLTKPWHPQQLQMVVGNAARMYRLQQQNRLLANELQHSSVTFAARLDNQRQQLKELYGLDQLVRAGDSPMNQVIDQLRQVAPFELSVLINGESGTGKELLARAIHYNSNRSDAPFVTENCGAMHDELLSSELFGHKKGAFTGATSDHLGLFEKADGGTIFLDEIGDISASFQIKLLRVLQEGEIRPLGANQSKRIDVRVVAATHKDLKAEVAAGRFRADLYYRLTTMIITALPLRQRPMDIIPIANSLLGQYAPGFGKPEAFLPPLTRQKMHEYPWPGNVRELQNEIQRLLVLSRGNELGPELLSDDVRQAATASHSACVAWHERPLALKSRVEMLEKQLITDALDHFQGNKSQTAEALGLSRVGLANKLERYDILANKEQYDG